MKIGFENQLKTMMDTYLSAGFSLDNMVIVNFSETGIIEYQGRQIQILTHPWIDKDKIYFIDKSVLDVDYPINHKFY